MYRTKNQRGRWAKLTALTAGMMLLVAACGDDSDEDAATDGGDGGGAEEVNCDFGERIVGIDPGAGLMEATREEVIPTYGLEDWQLVEGSTAAMLSELEAAIDNQECIAVTLWQPHWAYNAYDIKNLEDPEGALGEAEEIHTLTREGFADDHPEVAEWLGNFNLEPDKLHELEDFVFNQYDGEDNEAAVEDWLAAGDNQELADSWITSDANPGDLTIGFINWDEDVAVTALWEKLLTDQGYTVETTELDVAPLYQGLADGDLDFFLDAWLPTTHETYMDEFGDQIEDLGAWNESAALFIAVPSYADVDSLDELAE